MIQISQKGTEITLQMSAPTGKQTWTLTFSRNACNEFHAELEVDALRRGLREHNKEIIEKYAHSLWYKLRGNAERYRSKLGQAFDEVLRWHTH